MSIRSEILGPMLRPIFLADQRCKRKKHTNKVRLYSGMQNPEDTGMADSVWTRLGEAFDDASARADRSQRVFLDRPEPVVGTPFDVEAAHALARQQLAAAQAKSRAIQQQADIEAAAQAAQEMQGYQLMPKPMPQPSQSPWVPMGYKKY